MASIYDWLQISSVGDNDDADPQINWVEQQAPSTVNDSARAMMARQAFMWRAIGGALTYGGSSNNYTITTGESHTDYVDGEYYLLIANHTSAGAVTVQKDGIATPKKLFLPDGTTQADSGNITSGYAYPIRYEASADSAVGGYVLLSALQAASANGIALVSAANYAAMRTLLDLEAGIDFVALSGGAFSGAVQVQVNGSTAANAAADDFVINNESANGGLSIINGTGGAGSIFFGDTGDVFRGGFQYTHSDDALALYTAGSSRLTISSAGAVEASGTLRGRVARSAETSGTLTAASANKLIYLSGNITIDPSVFTADDVLIVYANSGSARTITQGSGMSLVLHGTGTTGTRTLAGNGIASIYFATSAAAIVSGDVT